MTSPTQIARRAYDGPTDLQGNPYSPLKPYRWLTEAVRAELAKTFDCDPAEIECRLDARDAMDAKIAERAERDAPYSHRRPGARALTYAEMVY